MYLEHLNLVVSDMPRSLAFYQAALPHWSIRGEGEQNWYGQQRRWLHFGDHQFYLTLNDHGYGQNRDLQSNTIGMAHFALVTQNLDALIQRMQQAGFELAHHGAASPHRRNVYYLDPDNYEIEFVEYLSDLPSERNLYD
ncbi:VOC family protein [Agarivorans sp.]|uniref:VOC family protein n=1 Tax=Agarivorans sp. TaxID=1872412 RepID=UPI003D07EB28